jgi:N-acetylmuramic acid 6-phosphate etherase
MLTEQPNPRSTGIDRLPTLDILRVMNADDAKVAIAVQRALPDIARAVDAIVRCLRRGGRLIYVGAGTSGRLGVLDAAECVPTFGTDPSTVRGVIAGGSAALTTAIEGAEDDAGAGARDVRALAVCEHDTVVGLAASGRTPYVLGALEAARQAGATTVAVACNAPSPLLDAAQIAIAVLVGPEIVAGSTRLKAGTAQKMVLNMLSTASMIRLGKVYGNLMVDVRVTNAKLATRARRLVARIGGVDEETARRLLAEAEQGVKPAIVMARLGVTAEEARHMLDAAEGRLGPVIDRPEAGRDVPR